VAGRRPLRAAAQKVRIFGLPGFVEDRGQICFSRGSSALFPWRARPERKRERERERTVVLGSYGVVFSLFARAILLCSHPSSTCSQLLLITGKKEKDLLLLSL
jgi:hypothetical protein